MDTDNLLSLALLDDEETSVRTESSAPPRPPPIAATSSLAAENVRHAVGRGGGAIRGALRTVTRPVSNALTTVKDTIRGGDEEGMNDDERAAVVGNHHHDNQGQQTRFFQHPPFFSPITGRDGYLAPPQDDSSAAAMSLSSPRARGGGEDDGDTDSTSPSHSLNDRNILNILAYTSNLLSTVLIGVGGLGGTVSTHAEVSRDFQSLVTPASWTSYVWILIYMSEGMFVLAQILPRFRTRLVVQEGVQYGFAQACMMQIFWTVFYSLRFIWLGWIFLIFTLLLLGAILRSLYRARRGGSSSSSSGNDGGDHDAHHGSAGGEADSFDRHEVHGGHHGRRGHLSRGGGSFRRRRGRETHRLEYWLLRFPFSLHFGWIVVLAARDFNAIFVARRFPPSNQLAMAVIALGVFITVGAVFLALQRPDYVVPMVMVWALFGIFSELRHDPTEYLMNLFDGTTISGIASASEGLGIILLIVWGPRIAIDLIQKTLTIQIVEH